MSALLENVREALRRTCPVEISDANPGNPDAVMSDELDRMARAAMDVVKAEAAKVAREFWATSACSHEYECCAESQGEDIAAKIEAL